MGQQDSLPESKVAALEARALKSKKHISPGDEVSKNPHAAADRISAIPRYRPDVYENLDYFVVGNDIPHSISDAKLFETRAQEGFVNSIHDHLFVGIGDMRNMFRTIIDVSNTEINYTKSEYRFLIVENKTAIIARDLLIAILLEELTKHELSVGSTCVNVLNTLFFMYTSRLVPQQTLRHIQEIISMALTQLRAGTEPVPWFRIRPQDIPAIIDCLSGWQTKAASVITPKQMVGCIQKCLDELPAYNRFGLSDLDSATEERLYYMSCFVYPVESVLQLQPKSLRRLVRDRSDMNMPERSRKIRELLIKHWAVNPVMIDLELLTKGRCTLECFAEHLQVGGNPLRVSQDLPEPEDLFQDSFVPQDGTAVWQVAGFLWSVSRAFLRLRGRVMVHAAVGDHADVLEHDVRAFDIKLRGQTDKLEAWPTSFDRMHFSNVPDYFGGHFSLFVIASPMLKQHSASWMTLNTARNMFVWTGNTQLLAEYVLTDQPSSLKELFNVKLIQVGENINIPVGGYARYGNHAQALAYEALIPRRGLTRWMHAHFLKITVPAQPQADEHFRVFAPLNLTNFLRLIARARELGYPAHWLSAILEEILSGNILSEARPPKTSPVAANAMQSQFNAMDMSTSPWVPEMRALCPIFQPILKFSLPDSDLPTISDLVRCTFSMPSFHGGGDSNNLSLVFWPKRYYRRFGKFPDALGRPGYMRQMLGLPRQELPRIVANLASLPDEVGIFRENGSWTEEFARELSVWTTFEWKAHSRTGVVVMESSYHKKLIEEDWLCGLWGSDHLEPANGDAMPVKEAFTEVQKWVDYVDGEQARELQEKLEATSIA